MSGEHTLKAVRGSFIDVTRTVDNPEEIASALRFIEDGLLLIKQGKVEWFGECEDGKHQIPLLSLDSLDKLLPLYRNEILNILYPY